MLIIGIVICAIIGIELFFLHRRISNIEEIYLLVTENKIQLTQERMDILECSISKYNDERAKMLLKLDDMIHSSIKQKSS